MHHRVQFGTRENPASQRQHGSCFAAFGTTSAAGTQARAQDSDRSPIRRIVGPARKSSTPAISEDTARQSHDQLSLHAAPQRSATGREATTRSNHLLTVHEVAELLQVPVSWVYGRTRKRSADPLPGYRLGKYWRFSETEIIAWINRQREA